MRQDRGSDEATMLRNKVETWVPWATLPVCMSAFEVGRLSDHNQHTFIRCGNPEIYSVVVR